MTNPFMFQVVDYLYKKAASITPEFFQERPMFLAPVLGFAGAYGLTRLIQKSVKGTGELLGTSPELYTKVLPVFEKAAKYGIPAAALLYAVVDPEGAKQIVMQHPVYTAGMTGAVVGGITAVNKNLEEIARSSQAPKVTNRATIPEPRRG